MASIGIGDFIRDCDVGIICGFVVGEGTTRYGRKELPCWRVRLADGKETLVLKDDAELVYPVGETQ